MQFNEGQVVAVSPGRQATSGEIVPLFLQELLERETTLFFSAHQKGQVVAVGS